MRRSPEKRRPSVGAPSLEPQRVAQSRTQAGPSPSTEPPVRTRHEAYGLGLPSLEAQGAHRRRPLDSKACTWL